MEYIAIAISIIIILCAVCIAGGWLLDRASEEYVDKGMQRVNKKINDIEESELDKYIGLHDRIRALEIAAKKRKK